MSTSSEAVSSVKSPSKGPGKNEALKALFDFDRAKRSSGRVICGIDEAGRGPLAGDVYAAAVVFSDEVNIEGLNDSKKLTEKKRELLYDEIIEKADAYCIATATVEEIEQYDILGATFLAMKRALDGLRLKPELALVDGNRLPPLGIETETIIKGDGTSASIAAASILAKVARDRYMMELDAKYPQYCFSKHKGYGTKLHYQMLIKYGLSPVHRSFFLRNLDEHKND